MRFHQKVRCESQIQAFFLIKPQKYVPSWIHRVSCKKLILPATHSIVSSCRWNHLWLLITSLITAPKFKKSYTAEVRGWIINEFIKLACGFRKPESHQILFIDLPTLCHQSNLNQSYEFSLSNNNVCPDLMGRQRKQVFQSFTWAARTKS